MAITKVQDALFVNEADDSVTKAWASTPTLNNLLIGLVHGTAAIGNAAITGWTLATSANWQTTPRAVGVFYKIAGASEGNVTLNWTGSTQTILSLMEYSGINTLDKVAYTNTNATTVETISSGTTAETTAAEELAVAAVSMWGVVTSLTWNNSFVAKGDQGIFWNAVKVLSSTGAQETTSSWTTAVRAGSCIATFKYVAGGPPKIKSINGVLIANVKTVNGIAIASVKSVQGIT